MHPSVVHSPFSSYEQNNVVGVFDDSTSKVDPNQVSVIFIRLFVYIILSFSPYWLCLDALVPQGVDEGHI